MRSRKCSVNPGSHTPKVVTLSLFTGFAMDWDLRVDGAGTASANGLYRRNGEKNGKPTYRKVCCDQQLKRLHENSSFCLLFQVDEAGQFVQEGGRFIDICE